MIKVAKIGIEDNDKILLIKRSKTSKFFPDQWDLPGGKLKVNEKPIDSVIRETKEETSLVIYEKDLEERINGQISERSEIIRYVIYHTSVYIGEVKLSNDHIEYSWVLLKDLDKLNTTPFVKLYFQLNN